MIGPLEVLIGLVLMLGLMFVGLHVGTAMFAVGLLGAMIYFGAPALNAVGEQLWGASEDYLLLSIPLYILLGELLVRAGTSEKMYRSLADWLNRLPGGLLHTNIGASAMFSAVSGSSVVADYRFAGFDRRADPGRRIEVGLQFPGERGGRHPKGVGSVDLE